MTIRRRRRRKGGGGGRCLHVHYVQAVVSHWLLPWSSRNPTRMRRTPTENDCAHHFRILSRSNRATCGAVSITRVVFSSMYPGDRAWQIKV
jgi:hypothetical protein